MANYPYRLLSTTTVTHREEYNETLSCILTSNSFLSILLLITPKAWDIEGRNGHFLRIENKSAQDGVFVSPVDVGGEQLASDFSALLTLPIVDCGVDSTLAEATIWLG